MRKAVACLSLILLGSFFSVVVLYYGKYQLEIGKAVESFLVFDVGDAEDRLGIAQSYVDYGRRLPLIGEFFKGPELKRAEIDYWQKEYQSLVNQKITDPESVEPIFNLIKGNSFYRMVESERDRATVIEGLESAIASFVQVINKDEHNIDAAFNYEYLVRVRDDVAKRKRKLPLKPEIPSDNGQQSLHGQEGRQGKDSGASTIKIHVPSDGDQRKNENEGQDAGKGAVKRGKG